ncbi:hypothetical protein GQX74_012873 [Glossina fuscipes]|nr:hypothetical protein GQX74_012873 [Glossina fuscipes]
MKPRYKLDNTINLLLYNLVRMSDISLHFLKASGPQVRNRTTRFNDKGNFNHVLSPECQANVEILWILSHIGIDGDERANKISKNAFYQSHESQLPCLSQTIASACRSTKGAINLDQ